MNILVPLWSIVSLGCHSQSSHELEEAYKVRIKTLEKKLNMQDAKRYVSFNNADVPSQWKGYNIYCGRNVGQSEYHSFCGYCDGWCGPGNECQCKTCHDLEEAFQLQVYQQLSYFMTLLMTRLA